MNQELKQLMDESKRIVFFGGAGVSTESGIPDFRSENGLYQAQSEYGYSPEEMLSHSFFMSKTETFFDYYKKYLIYPDVLPNQAHFVLEKLESQGKLTAIVTQNIDGLHQLAGSKNVYELHGSVLRNTCMECHASYALSYIMDSRHCEGKHGGNGSIPKCNQCGGIVKPDVVLYEEPLDRWVMERSIDAISKSDLLIVGGTSLVVYPAAGLITYQRDGRIVLINKTKTQFDDRAHLVIHDGIGTVLGE